MKVQFITDSEGSAQFVVLSIEEYKKLVTAHIPIGTDNEGWHEIEVEEDNHHTILPHGVISIMIDKQVSLLAAWRHYRGLTQVQVAEMTGIKQANLSNIEKIGNVPQFNTLEKLAKAYQCKVAQLEIVD